MLLMKKEYFHAIRCGRKTATLRYWRRRCVRPASTHRVPGLGHVRIDGVRQVDWSDLTDRDARDDGFDSLDHLRAALERLYPPQDRAGRKLYQIHFTLLPGATEAPDPSRGGAPAQGSQSRRRCDPGAVE